MSRNVCHTHNRQKIKIKLYKANIPLYYNNILKKKVCIQNNAKIPLTYVTGIVMHAS